MKVKQRSLICKTNLSAQSWQHYTLVDIAYTAHGASPSVVNVVN